MAQGPQYYGSIPTIAQAYQNDPRTKLAQAATAIGTSTAPVAGGGWAVPDGLARVAQALLGAQMGKRNDARFAEREKAYMAGMAANAQQAGAPQPQNPQPSPMAAPAAALAPPAPMQPPVASQLPRPMQTVDPDAAFAGQGAPQGVSPPPMAPAPARMDYSAARAPLAATAAPRQDAASLYRTAIVPIEGGTDPRTGAFRTSPKGAIGPGQIMPATAPEAAQLAGLPYDEQRYRTDPEYNNALGEAYYAKQLADFGDPVLAAAAYNGGPGRVRRALRRAERTGQPVQNFLPEETRNYMSSFAERMGAAGTEGGAAAPVDPMAGIIAPQMEAVPEVPAAPVAAPQAPQRPQEVQSNRIAMAQQLLESGNPDFAAIAQTYLDKGLDEQNNARMLASQQEQQQGMAGYEAGLRDYTGARSDARQFAYGDARDTDQRNFTRERDYTQNVFAAGQGAVTRDFQQTMQDDEQAYGAAQADKDRSFRAAQADLDRGLQRELTAAEAAARTSAAAVRNAYFDTAAGLKMRDEHNKQLTANNTAIGDLQRFMDLNEKQGTGGLALNTPGVGSVYAWTDDELYEMNGLANKATLAGLGGSLGAQISDGDRKFITDTSVSVGAPASANRNIARASIGALRRQNDYLLEFANAEATGTSRTFLRDWNTFVNAVPIVKRDRRGNAVEANDRPQTYAEWRASIPQYNAAGERVN